MIKTSLTEKALNIASDAHKNQRDKGGAPYILHPLHLAEEMTDEASTCVALLHDVIEDTDVTLEHLAEAGFYPEITEALALLTRQETQDYMEYIAKIKKNPLARVVKLADLRHNADLSRLEHPSEADLARREKYLKALGLLK